MEIINIIQTYLDKKLNYTFVDKIEGDPSIVYCDNTLAKNSLGLEIKYNIHDIIKSSINLINKYNWFIYYI